MATEATDPAVTADLCIDRLYYPQPLRDRLDLVVGWLNDQLPESPASRSRVMVAAIEQGLPAFESDPAFKAWIAQGGTRER